MSESTIIQLQHFRNVECKHLYPPIKHAAGLSAEHETRVPRNAIICPSIIKDTPES